MSKRNKISNVEEVITTAKQKEVLYEYGNSERNVSYLDYYRKWIHQSGEWNDLDDDVKFKLRHLETI